MRRQEDIKMPRPRKGNTCSYNMYEVDYNACTFLCTCFLFWLCMFRKRCSKEKRQQEAQAKATKCQSQSVEDVEARRQWEAQAQVAKRRSESLEERQEDKLSADLSHSRMRRQEDSKIPGLRQLSVNLSHSRIRRQGDSEKPGLRKGTVQELYCVQGCLHFCIHDWWLSVQI